VLIDGGVIRVVVPDLELLARRYVAAMDRIQEPGAVDRREQAVCGMIDQMVVRTPAARARRPLLVRLAEHLLIGDTARSGELHRWMYDRFSLEDVLRRAGFRQLKVMSAYTSCVPGWEGFRLDVDANGQATKEDSIYMEANR
jgi:hypothetical protein